MARCPAHGNRIQLNPSGAVNLFGATPQTDCRRTVGQRRGMKNPKGWARHVLAARQSKGRWGRLG